MSETKLESCPSCQGTNLVVKYDGVHLGFSPGVTCKKCYMHGPLASWNRRAHAGWHEEALRKWLELEAAYDRSTGAVATAKAAKAIQDHRAMVSALLPPGGEKG